MKLNLPPGVPFDSAMVQNAFDLLRRWSTNIGADNIVDGSITSAEIKDGTIAFADLSTGMLTYTYFVLRSTGYGAAPDTNFRFFANGTLVSDVHSSAGSWVTAAGTGSFQFPSSGKYLCGFGKRTPNAETGTVGCYLADGVGNVYPDGALRGYTPAGNDPSANIVRGGVAGSPFVFDAVASTTYKFGGYWNASVNFDVWFAAVKLP